MLGEIISWMDSKKYGFISDEHGIRRFFHISNIKDGVKPQIGDTVSFEPHVSPKGDAATAIKIIGKRGDTKLLNEIKEWKMEAKLEDNNRYFYHVKDVDSIESGKRSYVIGRKGCGKTAICEYLTKKQSPNFFAKKLSFKNFPFNELYQLSNDGYTAPNQYITLWKYLIYSTVAQLMLSNSNINSKIRTTLKAIYSDSLEENLQKQLSKWTSKNFEINILGCGIGVGGEKTKTDTNKSWINIVDFLERLLLQNIDNSVYLVAFDELDEDYKNAETSASNYSDLLTSLFKAVQDIKSIFLNEKYKVYPVIFIRNDIFKQLNDSDKTKFNDLSIELFWSPDQIKQLLAFRISRAISATNNILEFDEAWLKIFSTKPIIINDKRPCSIFQFISRCTINRPRDYIKYILELASAASDNDKNIIDPKLVVQIEAVP